jgi:hypothetical protein
VLYLKVFFFIFSTYFAACSLTNWFIDPYNEFGRNTVGLYYSTERQAKSLISSYEHDAILIGSSRPAKILPQTIKSYTFYNASFSNATPEEIYYFLKEYAKTEKLVVIGLDYEMFNERVYPIKERNGWSNRQFGTLEYLMSYKVLRDSIGALKKNSLKQKPLIAADGHFDQATNVPDQDKDAKIREQRRLVSEHRAETSSRTPHEEAMQRLEDYHYRRFQIAKKRLDYLRSLEALLTERGIKHIVFVNPYNEEVLNMIERLGYTGMFEDLKKEFKSIFKNFEDVSCCAYSDKNNYPDADPAHYKPEIGSAFLNDILERHAF